MNMFTSAYAAGGPYADVGSGGYGGLSAAIRFRNKPRTNVSYDTSSKDPVLVRSRIFVGGLASTVTREDVIQLFSPYGNLLGVCLFKGYGFVQYGQPGEADLAVSALNMYHWHGSTLDVKLAAKDKPLLMATATPTSTNGTSGKRPASQSEAVSASIGTSASASSIDAKKGRQQQSASVGGAGGSSGGAAVADAVGAGPYSGSESVGKREIADLFICGVCRFTTASLRAFVAHRGEECYEASGRKYEGEPEIIECCSCEENFPHSWGLIEHLSKSHNLAVYRQPRGADEKK